MTPPPAGETSGEPDGAPGWQRNLAVLCFGCFAVSGAFTLPFPFIPLMVREYGATDSVEAWSGAIVGGYFAFGLLLMPLWGAVADHFGRKSMVLRAGWGLTVGFLLLAASPSLHTFFAVFTLMGACDGFMASAQSFMAVNAPRRATGRALALLQAAGLLGSAVGPALGALLARVIAPLRLLYVFSAAVSLAGAALAQRYVREQHMRGSGRFRPQLLGGAEVLLRVPGMPLLFTLAFVAAVTFFGSNTAASLYTLQLAARPEHQGGWAVETWLGVVALALTISSALALPLWGRLLDRFEPTRVMLLGLGLSVLGVLPLPFVTSPLQLALCRVAIGLGGAGVAPMALALIRDVAPNTMIARALALATTTNMLGNALAPIAAGAIATGLGLRAYWTLNLLLLLGALAWWRLRGVRHGSV